MNIQEMLERLPPKKRIQMSVFLMKACKSFLPILGSLITIRDRPFTADFPCMLEPLFGTTAPNQSVIKAGRQIGKSTTQAVRTIVLSAINSYFQTLTVTPQFEMTRRYSANYVKPLLENSPIADIMLDTRCERNVLQRTLANQSIMHFSFCLLDADRIRGISSDRNVLDEIQDINYDFIPEISRTLDRSKWAIEDYSGTPKTFDGTLEILWRKSSMGEWLIPCDSCKKHNNPHTEADGLHMIQDRGLCCAYCGALLDSEKGRWTHFNEDKLHSFTGWHAPQIIFPFHYQVPKKWEKIVAAKHGDVSKRIFLNEIMGESCDVGVKLLTETDLRKACVLPVNMELERAKKFTRAYIFRALGLDWGGRGEDEISRTKAAVIGMRPDGRCDLLYAEDMSKLPDPGHEIARAIELFRDFSCGVLAHDASGTGGTRDVLFNHAKFPRDMIMPVSYVSAWSRDMLSYVKPNRRISWPHYSLDKTRSLLLTIECIKHGYMFFPAWESCKDYLNDFLALVEEKSDSRRGSDTYLIRRSKDQCDDFAHAVNFAMIACFHTQNKYPDLVQTIRAFSSEYLDRLEMMHNAGSTLAEWGD